jgi:predicted dehydrogenase
MLRGGIIGFGRMGITHFSILNSHDSAQIVAVCDQSKTMMSILSKYVNVNTYTDFRELIEKEKLDFVVIATPTGSHAELIKAALDHNLHIFTEKPLALTPEEGGETLKHLGDKNLVNQVGYVNRFNEVFMELKKLLDRGVIGEVKNFSSEMYGPTVLKDTKGSWRGKQKKGGGCMYEFASHCIDLAVYLMGKPNRVAGSIMQSIYSSGVDDLVISNFVYDNGCFGTIMVNWSDETYRKPTNIVKIFGTGGKIIADKHTLKVYLKEDSRNDGLRKGWNTIYITDLGRSVRFYVRGNEFTRQLDYFLDCIMESRKDNVSNFHEAYKTDILIEEIKQDFVRTVSPAEINLSETGDSPKPATRSYFWRKLFRITG